MFSKRKILMAGLLVAGMSLLPVGARADYSPTENHGALGLGMEVGDPGSWGFCGKLWVDRTNAFAPAVKLGDSVAILQLDYLWHNFDIFRVYEGSLPIYIGLGGNLWLYNQVVIAARLPIGLSYIFDKRNLPIDIYFQVVPTLSFATGGTTSFNAFPEVGAHFYL